jgi:enoyl-[acyl-carrier protein] reductase I
MTGLMEGKRGLIMGLANDKSLAWGIARKLHEHGAELAFSYQGEALEKRVRPLAASLGSDFLIECDVSDGAALDAAFAALAARWPTIDFIVHAVGFSDKNELRGKYMDTSLSNFLMTMNISAYSLVAVTQRASAMMPMNEDGSGGGTIVTLTYYGAEKVIPHYNVMIGDFRYILKWNEFNAPLRRNVTIDDVGGAGLYLLSDLSSGVTGEVHHVDAGYHTVGMKQEDAPDIALG